MCTPSFWLQVKIIKKCVTTVVRAPRTAVSLGLRHRHPGSAFKVTRSRLFAAESRIISCGHNPRRIYVGYSGTIKVVSKYASLRVVVMKMIMVVIMAVT